MPPAGEGAGLRPHELLQAARSCPVRKTLSTRLSFAVAEMLR